MTSKQLSADLDTTQQRLVEVQARISQIAPPPKAQPAPPDAGRTGWRPPDPLAHAGSEYRQVVEKGDVDALLSITEEHRRLSAERTMLFHRQSQFQRDLAAARQSEERTAAPKTAKTAVKAVAAALNHRDRARAELAAAEAEVEVQVRTLRRAREVGGPTTEALTPAQLRQLWTDPKGNCDVVARDQLSGRLFVASAAMADARTLLPEPSKRLMKAVVAHLSPRADLSEFARADLEKQARTIIATQRARLIAQGETLDDDRAFAEHVIATSGAERGGHSSRAGQRALEQHRARGIMGG